MNNMCNDKGKGVAHPSHLVMPRAVLNPMSTLFMHNIAEYVSKRQWEEMEQEWLAL
ncbi:hypothetical protein FRC11_008288, partial [Ceratobasidium sp. 423]